MKKRALKKDFRMEIKKSLNRFLSIFFIVAMGVAFFSGIQASAPDLRITGDAYFDETNLMDIRVVGTLGLTDQDMEALGALEGVETVTPGYMTDVLSGEGENQKVLHIEAILDQVNQPSLAEGSMPKQKGECFLDKDYADKMGYQIGDQVEVSFPEDTDSMLKSSTFTIVGTGYSSAYLSFARGSSTLGNGEVAGFMYLLPEDFDSEVYTVAYLTVSGAKELQAYSEEYEALVDQVLAAADGIEQVRCQARYEEVMDEANQELSDAKKELADGEQKLADAKEELEDGKAEAESELTKAREDLETGESELESGKEELTDSKEELEDARSQIADGEAELAANETKLNDGWSQLKDGESQLSEAERQLASQQAQFDEQASDSQSRLEEGQKKLEEAIQQSSEAARTLEEKKKLYEEGAAALAEGKTKYQQGEAAYAAGYEQYQQGETAYAAGYEQYQQQESVYEAGKAELDAGYAAYGEQESLYQQGKQAYEEGAAALTQMETEKVQAQDTAKEMRSEAERLTKENQELQKAVDEANAALPGLEQQLGEIDGILADLNSKKAEQVSAREPVQKNLDDVNKALGEAQQKLDSANQGLSDAQMGLNSAGENLASAETGLADAKAGLSTAQSDLSAVEAELSTAQSELEKAKAEGNEELVKQLEAKIKMYQEQIAGYQAQIANYNAQIADYTQQIEVYKGQIADYTSRIQDYKSQIDGYNSEIGGYRTQIAQYMDQIAVYDSKIAEYDIQISSKQQERDRVQSQYDDFLIAVKQNTETIQENQAAIETANQAAAAAEKKAAELEIAISQLLAQLETKKPELEKAEAALAQAKAVLDSKSQELAEGREKLDAAKAELEANRELLDDSKEKLEGSRTSLDQARDEIEKRTEMLNAAKSQLEQGAQMLADGQAQIEENRRELEAGKQQLEDAKSQLAAGWQQINSNKAKLASSREELLRGQAQLDEGRQTLADSRQKLADGEQKIAEAEATIAENEQKIKDGWEDYREGKKEAADQIKEGEAEIADAEETLTEAKQDLADAEEEIRKIEVPSWYVDDRNVLTEYSGFGENADRMTNIGRVFPVLFFLVAALISLTTMTRMVEEERTQIGTMKALGYSKKDIMSKYIKYALYATLGGSVFGFLVGEKILPYIIIVAYGMMYQHLPQIIIPYHWQYGAMAMGASLVCTLGATLSACSKELAATPAVLMRPPSPKEGKRVLLERLPFLWKRLSFTWKSTVRNLFRYKKRFFMTVIGIGGCMALLLVGFGLNDSIMGIDDLQYGQLQFYDTMVILNEDADSQEEKELEDYLAGEGQITGTKKIYAKKINTDHGKKEYSPYLYVPENTEDLEQFMIFRDRETHETYELTDEGAIVTEKLAKMLEVQVGDTITVTDSSRGELQIPVAAICENYLMHYIYLTPGLYEEVYGETPKYNTILVNMEAEEAQIQELGKAILNQEAALSVTYTNSVAEQMDHMLGALNIVIAVLIISAGMLAFVVLYNLNNININERKRELATIKVLGFYDPEVAAYVYRENILLTLIGTGVGIFLGSLLHRYTITTVEVDACMFGRNIDLLSFVYGSLFTFGFSAFVNFVMYFKLKKIDMVESLKSVE